MASNTHVDSRVAERRLRPIYDWLASGNNKKALQESEKVLKKQPNFLCAKVLKALALQRLGRESDCEQILEKVCSQVPTDEATLQAITICYRAIHKPDKICEVYLAASKKDPKNEELLTHLFMSYVRVGDYRKQHQHAMSLYKLRPKNPYYFWAVMSVVMQAKRDENIERDVALKLAEKMVTKFVKEGKIEAEQEVQLYLMILEMQGKYEEALDVIEGELGEKLKSLVTTSAKRIELLIKLERWKEANVLLKCQLERNPDSWSDYKNYLETILKVYSDYQKTESNDGNINDVFDNRVPIISGESIVWQEADYTPKMVQDFLIHLMKKVESEKKKIRGPYLAQLELYKLLKVKSLDPEMVVGNITDLLVSYFDRFGDKAICVSDLKPYLALMNINEASVFMKRITEIVGLSDGESPKQLSSLQKHICRLQISRVLGFHSLLPVDERLRLCDLILHHYHASNDLVSPDKLPTQFSCNDPYIILLSHILYSVYQDTNCKKHIIRAIYHLENALSSSPSNFHFKILLVKFYLLLGAGQQAFHFYEHLEVKYIQLDSLGFLIVFSLYGLGNFSAATSIYDTTLKFFSNNTNDSVDHLTYAYKYGSFMKIEEFIECHDRLNESLVYTFCTVENMLHYLLSTCNYAQSESAMKSMEIKPGIDKINWSKLRDNRDLNVFISYEPDNNQLNSRTVERTFENLKSYVKLRVLILKSLSAMFDFVSDNPSKNISDDKCIQNGNSDCAKNVLTDLVSELKCLYDQLNSQNLDLGIQDVINSPPPCRLKTFLKVPVHHLIADMTEIIFQMDDSSEKSSDEFFTQSSEAVAKMIETVTNSCISQLDDESLERRELLETLVGVMEFLSIAAILCGNLYSSFERNRKSQRKGKRRREETDGFDLQIYKNILTKVADCIGDLEKALDKISLKNDISNMSSEVKALTINDGDVGVKRNKLTFWLLLLYLMHHSNALKKSFIVSAQDKKVSSPWLLD
ncbi:UNVERIFIED_CONTAM: hypothetical protein PYX00_009405 [Menopon gallinae]|uniref:N-terminal acetyltransferase B complex subunit MDM20 homolog n=1 Tax=Menopon gallinae TaxID=328185 RepID=A0AAW2HAX5_9NEOP